MVTCRTWSWSLLLIFVTPQVGSWSRESCSPPHSCRAVQDCTQSHSDGHLDNLVLFQCGGRGFLCCPPTPSMQETKPQRNRPSSQQTTTESNTEWIQTEPQWEEFFSETTTTDAPTPRTPIPHPYVSHRNLHLLPDSCGMGLSNKIVGGQDSAVAEYPWMSLVGFTGNNGATAFVCGGTLINERYVLTAAHCLYREEAVLSHVRLGEYDLTKENDCNGEECYEPAVDLAVAKIIPHPGWNNQTYRNDIALLRLNTSAIALGLSTISPICLPMETESLNITDGYKYEAAGWGLTGWRENALSNILQKTHLGEKSLASCNNVVCPESRQHQLFCPLERTQMCVQGVRRRDVCKGDSGGPLMTQNHIPTIQLGITSFKTTEVCGEDDIPTTFTRVETYISWILDNIEP